MTTSSSALADAMEGEDPTPGGESVKGGGQGEEIERHGHEVKPRP